MSESLLVALISGFCTLAGSCAGVLASSRLTQYRLAQLEKRVAQHNNLIERTYRLEGRWDEAEAWLAGDSRADGGIKKGWNALPPKLPDGHSCVTDGIHVSSSHVCSGAASVSEPTMVSSRS